MPNACSELLCGDGLEELVFLFVFTAFGHMAVVPRDHLLTYQNHR